MKQPVTLVVDIDKIREDLNLPHSLVDNRTLLLCLVLIGKQTIILSKKQNISCEYFRRGLKKYVSYVLKKNL